MNPANVKSKYSGLTSYLLGLPRLLQSVSFYFKEIESIIGAPLPASAVEHRAWWANQAQIYALQARGWLDAGFEVDKVDLLNRTVRLVRVGRLASDQKSLSTIQP